MENGDFAGGKVETNYSRMRKNKYKNYFTVQMGKTFHSVKRKQII